MPEDQSSHPSEDELDAYARGTLNSGTVPRVEEHILVCAECRDEVQNTLDLINALRKSIRPVDIRSRRHRDNRS